MQENFTISIKKESIYIFCKNSTTLDCKTIYNLILESIKDNETYNDIKLQDLYSYEIYVFLDSILLNGSKEIESNPLYFGELDSKGIDSKNELDETKPIYYLESTDEFDMEADNTSNTKSSNNVTDSKTNPNNSNINANRADNQTLQIFLEDSTLTLLNYSLLDSTLNIKLELLSKESKAILEREKAQRDKQKEQDSKAKDSQSTAMLHPVLEDNDIKCPHNGVVKLKSNKGKPFKSKDIPMILESDLINSSIIGCTNNILGVPTPCNLVSIILPSARGLKNQYAIM